MLLRKGRFASPRPLPPTQKYVLVPPSMPCLLDPCHFNHGASLPDRTGRRRWERRTEIAALGEDGLLVISAGGGRSLTL